MKGYDSAFRLCIPWDTEDGVALFFMESLNGITLTTGEDLYGSRLKQKQTSGAAAPGISGCGSPA